MAMMHPDQIGAEEAAEILQVDRSTLTRMAQQGVVPVLFRLPGRTGARVFSRTAVEKIAQQRRRDAHSDRRNRTAVA